MVVLLLNVNMCIQQKSQMTAEKPKYLHTSVPAACSSLCPLTHLSFQSEKLVSKLLLLLFQQLVDLVGLDPLAHQLEVSVVFLSELLHQTDVLFLHVLKGLTCHIHLTQQGVLLLDREQGSDMVSQRGRELYGIKNKKKKGNLQVTHLFCNRELFIEYVDLLFHRADLPQGLFIRHFLALPPLPLLQLPQPLSELLSLETAF